MLIKAATHTGKKKQKLKKKGKKELKQTESRESLHNG